MCSRAQRPTRGFFSPAEFLLRGGPPSVPLERALAVELKQAILSGGFDAELLPDEL